MKFKPLYKNQHNFKHENLSAVGVLLMNLGTPDAPTAKALRPYLAQFLSDPRVIEKPRWQWLPILHGIILRLRPRRSAALYKDVWDEKGSPLRYISESQRDQLETLLQERFGNPMAVAVGMRYGNPSIEKAVTELKERGVQKMLVLPVYPQYSATSTASVFDGVVDELKRWRFLPEFRFINSFHDDPAYIECLAKTVRDAWATGRKPEKLLMSFHGIPTDYFLSGDPYFCHCQKTARLLAESLGLKKEEYAVTFQSLFGRMEWLKPATEDTLREWAKLGVKSVDVMCPGFAVDCLETIQEIDMECREAWEEEGGKGEDYRYIPALNDNSDFMEALADLAARHMGHWGISKDVWDEEAAKKEAAMSEERAKVANY